MDLQDKENPSFWNLQNSVMVFLSLGIPISLIVVNACFLLNLIDKYNIGFDLANSIVLLTAGLAITGTLYSNHENNNRSITQLKEQKRNLYEELLFDKKSKGLLRVETAFFKYNDSPDNRYRNSHLCQTLRVIRDTPDEFYYLPKELKKAIQKFYDYTRVNQYTSGCISRKSGPILPKDDEIEIYFKEINDQLQKALKDLDETIYLRTY